VMYNEDCLPSPTGVFPPPIARPDKPQVRDVSVLRRIPTVVVQKTG